MGELDRFKGTQNPYNILGFKENPFSIAPLFEEFRNKELSEKDEKLLVLPEKLKRELSILLRMKGRRVMSYGEFGVGKTTFINFLMYLFFHYHKKFSTKIIVTEENLKKAANELLFSLCSDIIDIIKDTSLKKPRDAVRKIIIDLRHKDFLFDALAKLIGEYEERRGKIKQKEYGIGGKVEPAGVGAEIKYSAGAETITSIKSYVDTIPMKKIEDYLNNFADIVNKLGYNEVVIGIDEADHLPNIGEFLKLIIRSRLIFFAPGYSFLVAGSPEIARYTEEMGRVFDKLLFFGFSTKKFIQQVFQKRITALNPSLQLSDIFEESVIDEIYSYSQGALKYALRLAENAIDECVASKERKVRKSHVVETIKKDEIKEMLDENEKKILTALTKLGKSSSSNKELQRLSNLSRPSLHRILKGMLKRGLVRRHKEGKTDFYSPTLAYKKPL